MVYLEFKNFSFTLDFYGSTMCRYKMVPPQGWFLMMI